MFPRPPTPRHAASAAFLLTAVAALALLPAAPASAHDELVRADPAAGSTVTAALPRIDLTFAEPLVDLGGHRNGVVVLDEHGRHFETACAAVDGDDLVAPVALGAAGTYRVQWRGVSDDGHIVGAVYSFTYRPPAGTTSAAGSAAGPACGATTAGDDAAQQPVADGGAIAVGAIAGGAALIAVAVVLIVVLRARRSQDEETGE